MQVTNMEVVEMAHEIYELENGEYSMAFVGDTPWVHIDIAGTFESDKEKGYVVKGATGVGVRTLINLAFIYAAD